jgi:sialic acid synthase SpsE
MMKTIDISGFEVGGDKTFIIADIGSNHKQDLALAKESIIAAAEAGANAVKFQSIQLGELYLRPDQPTREFIKKLEFPEEWHLTLKEFCDSRSIIFFSSPTYLKAVDLLEGIHVPLYKLASAQVGTFPQIVEKVAALGKPTIFSTGIVASDEITSAVHIFRRFNNSKYIILHCNSIYPTPPERVNLHLMQKYAAKYDCPVGFSDHTEGTTIACAAVSLGASVIEKHFTLDRRIESPDSNSFASDPAELRKLVEEIRAIEAATRTRNDRQEIQPEEKNFKDSITYRIVANRDISEAHIISPGDLTYLRHGEGINCKEEKAIIGKKAKRIIRKHELISFNDVI